MDTVCRAITFPFTPHSLEWKELDPLLSRAWGMSTHLANWAMSELFLADQLTLDRTVERLGPMPNLYLYGLFSRSYPRRQEWQGAAAAANCIFRSVQKKYAAKRLDIVWRGSSSLPSFRFPYPFPVHNQNWSAVYGKGNVPLVTLSLPGGRVVLRLRGGAEMRRQLAGFRQIIQGAKTGEAAIYRKNRHAMIKLVAHFPIRENQEATNTLLVRTDPNAFWVAEMEGTHPRVWNQDHIKDLVTRHRVWLQRVSEDTKREKRVPRPMRRHIDQAREDRCRKMNDRLTTFCHEMSKQLVEFAVRQKVSSILYDDACKDWIESFPWSRLEAMLEYKCKDRGIKFVSAKKVPSDDVLLQGV